MGLNDSSAIILIFPLVGVSSITCPLLVHPAAKITAKQTLAIITGFKILYAP